MGGEIWIIIPVNVVVGVILKNSSKVREWQITWILCIISFILALLFNVLKGITVIEILLNSTIQAILAVGGAAVFKDIYESRRLKLREENISEEVQQ